MAGPPPPTSHHHQFSQPQYYSSPGPTEHRAPPPNPKTLPKTLKEELDRLCKRVAEETPNDIIQFCADHFAERLREERRSANNRTRAEEQRQREAVAQRGQQGGGGNPQQQPQQFQQQQQQQRAPEPQRDQPVSRTPSPRGRGNRPPPSSNRFRPQPQYQQKQMASPGVEPQGLFSSSYSAGGQSALEGGPTLHPDQLREVQEEAEDSLHDLRQSPTAPSFRLMTSPPPSASSAASPFSTNSPFGAGPFSPQTGGFSDMGPPTGGLMSGPPSAALRRSPSPSSPDFPSNYSRVRRVSVSAESLAPSAANDEWSPPVYPKTAEQLVRLKKAIQGIFLFNSLDEEQFQQVLAALNEKPIPAAGTRIITQGDVGDFFYIVDKGVFDIYVNKEPANSPTTPTSKGASSFGTKVTTCEPGQFFGELALMYNSPRAATVISTTPNSIVWSLDRITFRRIVMENTFKRRRMYEAFLGEVPLLVSLEAYERNKIADALETRHFEPNEIIIRQGDVGDNFYLLVQGEAEVFLSGTEGSVKKYVKGDYFGELALLNDEPRAASVVAKNRVKVAYLGKDGFMRLLGPVTEIMRRNDPRRASSSAAADSQEFSH